MPKLKFTLEIIDSKTISLNGEIIKRYRGQSNRFVYRGKKFVVKFDNHRSVWNNQCEPEYLKWLEVKGTEYAKHFAKTYEFGNINGVNYVIQERVFFTHPDREYKKTGDSIFDVFYHELRDIQGETGVSDMHENNWGLKGRTIKIFDYAL